MTIEERYKERYQSGDTPWDIGEADFNLVDVVTRRPIEVCKALDVGCGTGDNAIWLAANQFQVVATDASEVAVSRAREKARQANIECDFRCVDFFQSKIEGAPFGFIFDRGCFHSFNRADDRQSFARKVADHLEGGGWWLTLAGNADEDRKGPGPPQRTAGEIVAAVEPYFQILSLVAGRFGSKSQTPPMAWIGLMRKRSVS